MEAGIKREKLASSPTAATGLDVESVARTKAKNKPKDKDAATNKRRCVSTACIACRRRKSKCDGNLPKCAACASVYLTDCEYAPHTDHRRKGVYKKDIDNLKTKNSTLQILIQAILNADEEEHAFDLVRQIRACDNLEDLAQTVENKERGIMDTPDSPIYGSEHADIPQFEAELSGRMGDLVLDGAVKFIGGTSNLIWLNDTDEVVSNYLSNADGYIPIRPVEEGILRWTTVTRDKDLILHLMNMYFCWHYAYFTTLSKELFYRDFLTGTESQYCSSHLVNSMLTLGCHFSSNPAARADPDDASTTGDHFFAEARRLLHQNDTFAIPRLCTVQALALMSVREAGCARESRGWIYSGMSFRLASDLGLNVDAELLNEHNRFSDEEIDARRITFWGCFLFDKCWSNYLGRQPQLLLSNNNVKKPDVFGTEDSEMWSPYTDSGIIQALTQPARTRAVSLQTFKLAEISSDLLTAFYQPHHAEKATSRQGELKKLSDIHTRLEAWKKELPTEMEPKDGQLPQVLLMHMFYQLLYMHLYRPFLKYTKATSPLPNHVSPRKFCTQAAGAISKLFRLYKRTHGLRQICNIAVYIAHSACTIHLLNLPDKNAKRDIVHGVKHLEEIGEAWTCARRTLRILGHCAQKWKIELPEEAQAILYRETRRWSETPLSPMSASPGGMPINHQLHSQSEPDISDVDFHQFQTLRQHSESGILPNTAQSASPTMSAATMSSIKSRMQNQGSIPTNLPAVLSDGLGRDLTRSNLSVRLTQAQQDAWNAHQARMGHLSQTDVRPLNEQPVDAATLFGGVDSLMEESHQWWYRDQSQIALGFDNWNTGPQTDWVHATGPTNDLSMSMSNESGTRSTPTESIEEFMQSASVNARGGSSGTHIIPPTSAPGADYSSQAYLQTMYQRGNPMQPMGVNQPSGANGMQGMFSTMTMASPTGRKRTGSHEDELMY